MLRSLAGWRDSLKWGICVRPGMGPEEDLMTEKTSGAFYAGFLDQLGKLVVGSGAILGLAYISGWVYCIYFYWILNSLWVMNFIDPQGFLREGLPIVLTCTAMAAVSFFSFSDSEYMKGFGNLLLFWVGTIALFATFISTLIGNDIGGMVWVNGLLALFYMMYSSSALGLAIKMIEEGKPRISVLLVSALGLGSILLIFPVYMADQNARALKIHSPSRSVVVDDKGSVLGVLINSVAGKSLISDCKKPDQMFIAELSSSLKIRPEKDNCL
jgi:hypothetical protein